MDGNTIVLIILLSLLYILGFMIAAVCAANGVDKGSSTIALILGKLRIPSTLKPFMIWTFIVLWPIYMTLGIIKELVILFVHDLPVLMGEISQKIRSTKHPSLGD